MRLAGKVAFISGGARGMGATEAKLFANEGAAVAIGDVLEEAGKRTEAEINQSGGQALFVSLDVTSEQSWLDAIGATVAKFGRLDILVNNAGVSAHGMIEFTTEADWDRVMDVNSKGPFLALRLRYRRCENPAAVRLLIFRLSLGWSAQKCRARSTSPRRALSDF